MPNNDNVLTDEILALDMVCLRAPGGEALDARAHRATLDASLERSRAVAVRRNETLVAYAYAWPMGERRWFVGGLAIHPDHRNARVTAELFARFADVLRDAAAVELHSHVLADNEQSIRLHRRLGFAEIQRDARAIAFRVMVSDLPMLPPVGLRPAATPSH